MSRLPLLLALILVIVGVPPVMGATTFRVAVHKGGYALYRVTEAYNISVGDYYLKRGDRLGFVVKGTRIQRVAYMNGTTAFQVEIVLCDVYLNDRLLLRNTTPQQFGLFSPYAPPGLDYWAAQERVLRSLKNYYDEHGNKMYYSLVNREDYVRLYLRLESSKGMLEEESRVNVDTGLLLEFSRHIYNSAGRIVKAFSGTIIEYATSKPATTVKTGTSPTISYEAEEYWLWVLLGMIIIVILGGFLGARRRG